MSGTKIDIDELERVAWSATPGLWSAIGGPKRMPDYCSGFGVVLHQPTGEQIADAYGATSWPDAQCFANAAHIAANSPDVTLGLIARIRELEEVVKIEAMLIESKMENVIQHAEAAVHVDELRTVLAKGCVLP
jgi:hypothetical protein